MILPIYAYGQPVLKKIGKDITKDYPKLDVLLENMWETMYKAKGVGLAAPQIGLQIRLFLVDTIQMENEDDDEKDKGKGIKEAFINAEIIEEGGNKWAYEEGCLSIPNVNGDVERLSQVKIKYLDADFKEHTKVFSGINARVIQHEYDHIDGKLFTQLLKPIKKARIKKKLENIKKGNVDVKYKMKFVK